jgi:hypothetical protein
MTRRRPTPASHGRSAAYVSVRSDDPRCRRCDESRRRAISGAYSLGQSLCRRAGSHVRITTGPRVSHASRGGHFVASFSWCTANISIAGIKGVLRKCEALCSCIHWQPEVHRAPRTYRGRWLDREHCTVRRFVGSCTSTDVEDSPSRPQGVFISRRCTGPDGDTPDTTTQSRRSHLTATAVSPAGVQFRRLEGPIGSTCWISISGTSVLTTLHVTETIHQVLASRHADRSHGGTCLLPWPTRLPDHHREAPP